MAFKLNFNVNLVKRRKNGKCDRCLETKHPLYDTVHNYHSGQWAGHLVDCHLTYCKDCVIECSMQSAIIETKQRIYTYSEMHKKIPLKNDWSKQPLIIIS